MLPVLVQQGRLELDESANVALRSWKIPDSTYTRGRPVTVRMLLNHTASLDHVDSDSYRPFSAGDALPTLLQVLEGKAPPRRGAVEVVSTPGTAFAYSAEPLAGRFRVGPELAVAGLWTTPTDIARYIIAVQRAYAGRSHQTLEPGMAREMLNPGLGSRGLGPAISGSGQAARFGHDGFNEGFESSFVAYERGGQGAVVMANSGFAFMLIKEVLSSISRVYGWPDYGATTQQPPSASIQQQRVSPVPADILQRSSGQYSMGDIRIRLYRNGDRLYLDWPTNGIAEVFAAPDGRFFCPPLIFSDVGSPWLRFVSGTKDVMTKILAGDDESAEFTRLD